MLGGQQQPIVGDAVYRSTDTPLDIADNARPHSYVPGGDNYFSAIAGFVDTDCVVGPRTRGHVGGVVTADGGRQAASINVFEEARRERRLSGKGSHRPAMASAARTGIRPNGSRSWGPSASKTQL
jgi:hypothetical protein